MFEAWNPEAVVNIFLVLNLLQIAMNIAAMNADHL